MNRYKEQTERICDVIDDIRKRLDSLSLDIRDLSIPLELRTAVMICMAQSCSTSVMRSRSAWYGTVTYIIDDRYLERLKEKVEERKKNIAARKEIIDEASCDGMNNLKTKTCKKDDCFTVEDAKELNRLDRLSEMKKLCKDAADRQAKLPHWKRNLLRDSGKSTLYEPRPPVDNGEDFY